MVEAQLQRRAAVSGWLRQQSAGAVREGLRAASSPAQVVAVLLSGHQLLAACAPSQRHAWPAGLEGPCCLSVEQPPQPGQLVTHPVNHPVNHPVKHPFKH